MTGPRGVPAAPDWRGTISALAGIPVITSGYAPIMLPVFVNVTTPKIVVRYVEDVPARIRWDAVKAAMRADVRRQLDDFADRVDRQILGGDS